MCLRGCCIPLHSNQLTIACFFRQRQRAEAASQHAHPFLLLRTLFSTLCVLCAFGQAFWQPSPSLTLTLSPSSRCGLGCALDRV